MKDKKYWVTIKGPANKNLAGSHGPFSRERAEVVALEMARGFAFFVIRIVEKEPKHS